MLRNINILYHITKCQLHTTSINQLNCHRTPIARIGRAVYSRMYPAHLVFSDGSSIKIRYHEPRKIIKLPLDLSTLTDEERKRRLESRKPKPKVILVEEIEDNFNLYSYKHLWKK